MQIVRQKLALAKNALPCQLCKREVHAACHNIPQELYTMLVEKRATGLVFFCEGCNVSAAGLLRTITSQQIKMTALENKIEDLEKNMKTKVEDAVSKEVKSEAITHIIEEKIKIAMEGPELEQKIKDITVEFQPTTQTINECVKEEISIERRKNRVIIHGLEENNEKGNVLETSDHQRTLTMLKLVHPRLEQKNLVSCQRIGKRLNRALLVEFNLVHIKQAVMRNLGKLGGKGYRVSIVHDLTRAQREECRKLLQEAKEQDEEGKFKVVGPPGRMKIARY